MFDAINPGSGPVAKALTLPISRRPGAGSGYCTTRRECALPPQGSRGTEMNCSSEEPGGSAAGLPAGCVMSRLSASGPHRSSLWRRLRPRENAATLLRGARAAALALAALAVLALALPVQAQTQTPVQLVSTIEQTNVGSAPGPFELYDAAQAFTTGTDTNGYKLTSVGLRLYVAAGTSGWVYSVSVWSATATGSPDTSLGTLTNPALATGTTAYANYTFTESGNGIDLDASTTYVIVVDVTTRGTGTGTTAVSISNTVSDDEDTVKATGWSIADGSLYRDWDSTGAWTTFDQTRRIRVNGYAKAGTPNNPPTSAEQYVEADEDTDYTFLAANFGFADTDASDSLASVKIVTLPASGTGTLTLSGTAIVSGDLPQTVPADEIDDLKYSPPANLYGTDVASFTFKVNDGTVDSDNAYTMNIDVKGMDDPATGKPGITGTAQVGQTLTATVGTIADLDGLPDPLFSATTTVVQWIQVDGATETDISGATNETYTLATADAGKKIKVKVSFEDDDGTVEGPLTSEAFPSSGTVGSANALTIRRLGGGSAGVCALLDTRPNPPVGGVFCLGVWFNGADPAGFTESDLEIENGTVVNFQYRGSTNMVQRITVNVAGDIGEEFVFRIVRNALDAGNAEAVYRATITVPPATLTMSSSAAEPVTGDFSIDLEFTHTVEGERQSLEPLSGKFPMITNSNIGEYLEVTNGNLVRYANFDPIGDRNFDLVVGPYANFEGRLSVVFHSDQVQSVDYSGIWFPEARFGIEVDTKSPTLETVALADNNRRLLDLTFHEELVAGSLPTVNDFRVVADGGSVGLATLHALTGTLCACACPRPLRPERTRRCRISFPLRAAG